MLRLMAGHGKGLFILPVLSIFFKLHMRVTHRRQTEFLPLWAFAGLAPQTLLAPCRVHWGAEGMELFPPQDQQDFSR